MHYTVLYTLFTAVAVSADSLVAGLVVSLGKQKNILLPTVVAVTTFVMCLTSSISAKLLYRITDGNTIQCLGALVLCIMGVANLLPDNQQLVRSKPTLSESVSVGLAVGTDAFVANFTLANAIGDVITLPVIFALFHYVAVTLGQHIAEVSNVKAQEVGRISGVMLVVLAFVKLL